MGWWGNWRLTAPAHIGNLQATDLLDCTSIIGGVEVNNTITGAQIIAAASGGSSPYTTVGDNAGILVNNSTTNTISASILIPGSTLVATQILQLRAQVRKIGGTGTSNIRFYINTTNTLVGATQIGQAQNMTGSGLMQRVGRDIYITISSLQCYLPTNPIATDLSSGAMTNVNYTLALPYYLIAAVQNSTLTESTTVTRLNLMTY
jgi:riboflavin transporter FmnP